MYTNYGVVLSNKWKNYYFRPMNLESASIHKENKIAFIEEKHVQNKMTKLWMFSLTNLTM